MTNKLTKLLVLIFLLYTIPASSQTKGYSELDSYISNNPVGTKDYYLQMQNIAGMWENMILIFGYGAGGDLPACEAIAVFAKQGSPNRNYRCTPAN